MCTTLDGAISDHYERREAKASTSSTSSHDWLSPLKVWVQRSRERNELAELVNDEAFRYLKWPTCLIEGINSLVQAAKAKARGYRSLRNLMAIIYLIAGKIDLKLAT